MVTLCQYYYFIRLSSDDHHASLSTTRTKKLVFSAAFVLQLLTINIKCCYSSKDQTVLTEDVDLVNMHSINYGLAQKIFHSEGNCHDCPSGYATAYYSSPPNNSTVYNSFSEKALNPLFKNNMQFSSLIKKIRTLHIPFCVTIF